MNDQKIEAEIQAKGLTAPRVSLDDLTANIVDTEILKHVSKTGQVLRWAIITTANGFAAVGDPSVSVSQENDDAEIGEKVAIANTTQRLWPLMGYALKDRLYQASLAPTQPPADNDHIAPGCEPFAEPVAAVSNKTFLCPRREGMPAVFKLPDSDHLREDGTCSYCGSLDGDALMARIEAGTIFLSGSDKNYKTYLKTVEGGPPLLQSSRIDDDRSSDQSKWRWETREVDHGKFYFMHLSVEQMKRFVELWNQKRIKNNLYVMPYFMK